MRFESHRISQLHRAIWATTHLSLCISCRFSNTSFQTSIKTTSQGYFESLWMFLAAITFKNGSKDSGSNDFFGVVFQPSKQHCQNRTWTTSSTVLGTRQTVLGQRDSPWKSFENGVFGKRWFCLRGTRHFRHFRRSPGSEECNFLFL